MCSAASMLLHAELCPASSLFCAQARTCQSAASMLMHAGLCHTFHSSYLQAGTQLPPSSLRHLQHHLSTSTAPTRRPEMMGSQSHTAQHPLHYPAGALFKHKSAISIFMPSSSVRALHSPCRVSGPVIPSACTSGQCHALTLMTKPAVCCFLTRGMALISAAAAVVATS